MTLRVTVLGILLVAAAPVAQADLTLSLQVPPEALDPGQWAMVTLTVSDDCQDLLARAAPGSQAVQFELVPETWSSFIVRSGEESGVIPIAPCLSGEESSSATLEWGVGLNPGAPCLEALRGDVSAVLAGQGVTQTRTATGSLTVHAKPVFVMRVDVVDGQPKTIDGNRGVAHLEVINHSNCKTTFTFEVVDEPGAGAIELPDPLVVNSEQSGLGHIGNATLGFVADGGPWEAAAVTVQVTPSSFIDPSLQGHPYLVHVLFRNGNAVERSLPSPPLPLALMVVAFAAVVARRRA